MHYDVMFVRPKTWAMEPTGESVDHEPPSFVALVSLVEAAISASVLPDGDAREAAHLLWSAIHGVVALALTMDDLIDGYRPDQVRERAATAVEAVIAALR